MKLEEESIHAWIVKHQIKTETGLPLDFRNHTFMFDVYRDLSPKQAITKAAQITASTCFSIKVPWVVKNLGLDAIYTLPTEDDRNAFVGGKVNRIIAQNPILQEWTKDKDSIEQKQIGDNFIHFRGTWTQKAAIMVPSDLNCYDEVDASKLSVIEQYATRLQHSQYKWEWYFSHPSTEGTGVDRFYQQSDQKHWFIKCPKCNEQQYLSWPESIDQEKGIFVCKACHAEIDNLVRRRGQWVKKYLNKEISGYWIPLLICPWVSAKEIIGYHQNKSEEYFYNKVLGLPYVGGGNKLTKDLLFQNLTGKKYFPDKSERLVMGVDTGLKIDYVIGGVNGLFYQADTKDYDELDDWMLKLPKLIAVIDAGGDLIGSRQFKERWPGRVFLCYTGGDKKTTDNPIWNDDERIVNASRDKMIQLVVDEFRDGRVPLQGSEDDWYEYWLDWNNVHRIKVMDATTGVFKSFKWVRDGRDHRAMATVYWRVGMMRFGNGDGSVISFNKPKVALAPHINPDGTSDVTYMDVFRKLREKKQGDWRKIL